MSFIYSFSFPGFCDTFFLFNFHCGAICQTDLCGKNSKVILVKQNEFFTEVFAI